MGAGSTIAAACAVGYRSIGIELDPGFYRIAVKAIPKLAILTTTIGGNVTINQASTTSQEELFVFG